MGGVQSTPEPEPKQMAAPNLALADVPTEELLRELSHRLECSKKPEKRIILIGGCYKTRVGHAVAGSYPTSCAGVLLGVPS